MLFIFVAYKFIPGELKWDLKVHADRGGEGRGLPTTTTTIISRCPYPFKETTQLHLLLKVNDNYASFLGLECN